MGPEVDGGSLLKALDELAQVGAIEGGGCARLALSDEDKAGRDLVVGWMKALGLEVGIDAIGNVVGLRPGRENLPPIMTGSHIDTVRTGGRYDGNYGVLAGLEIVRALNVANIATRRPIAVAFFTNEEGARFQPDMMGSLVYAGGLGLNEAYAAADKDGIAVGDELRRIGYLGTLPPGALRPHAFLELHIEQGPILDEARVRIGVVESVQGISWTEYTVTGVFNHAGTTDVVALDPQRIEDVEEHGDGGESAGSQLGKARLRPIEGDVLAVDGKAPVALGGARVAHLEEAGAQVKVVA